MPLRDQIRKGSSETLILSLLAQEPMYGYQITQELERRSGGYFDMKEGLLYPTLHRMEQEGLVESEWRTVAGRRRRKSSPRGDARRWPHKRRNGVPLQNDCCTCWIPWLRRQRPHRTASYLNQGGNPMNRTRLLNAHRKRTWLLQT